MLVTSDHSDKTASWKNRPKPIERRRPIDTGQLCYVLAAALRKPSAFMAAKQRLRPEHFHAGDRHFQIIWTSGLEFVAQHGKLPNNDQLRAQVQAALTTVPDPDKYDTEELAALIDGMFGYALNDLDETCAAEWLRMFLEDRLVEEIGVILRPGLETPKNVVELLGTFQDQLRTIAKIPENEVGTIEDEWEEYKRQQDRYRGKSLIGLKTGLDFLDEHTLGLRGTTILASRPNAGKTALACHLAIGIARHHDQNGAVVVFVSLDMNRHEIYDRIFCNVAEMNWRTWKFGTPGMSPEEHGKAFSVGDQKRVDAGCKYLKEQEIARRLMVHDQSTLGARVTAPSLLAIGEEFKCRLSATRALYVIDYLQLLPVPPDVEEQGDLVADRHRIGIVKEIARLTHTAENPDGDAVLAISEARKPSKSGDKWGRELSEVMGSARTAYTADAVLTFWSMNDDEVKKYFGVEQGRQELQAKGISPVMLCLAKGRDGMTKGEWPMDFYFRESRFVPREGRGAGGMEFDSMHAGKPPDSLLAECECDDEKADIAGGSEDVDLLSEVCMDAVQAGPAVGRQMPGRSRPRPKKPASSPSDAKKPASSKTPGSEKSPSGKSPAKQPTAKKVRKKPH